MDTIDDQLKPMKRLHMCKDFLIEAGVTGVRVESELVGELPQFDESRGAYVYDTIDIPTIGTTQLKLKPTLILGYANGFGVNVHPDMGFAELFLSPTEKNKPLDNAAYMKIGRAAEKYGIILHPDVNAVIEEIAGSKYCGLCVLSECESGKRCSHYKPKVREQFVYRK